MQFKPVQAKAKISIISTTEIKVLLSCFTEQVSHSPAADSSRLHIRSFPAISLLSLCCLNQVIIK